MMTEAEKMKIEGKYLFRYLSGLNRQLRRGAPTNNLRKMYAVIPVADTYAARCNGYLAGVEFGKFVGRITIMVEGGIDVLKRDCDEFRIIAEAADDMEFFSESDERLEVCFTFYDIYEALMEGSNIGTRMKIKYRSCR